MSKTTKRVGKPKGVTDKDVIVAQKKAEKEAAAAEEMNPLRQVYREGQTITLDASRFRSMINSLLYLQQENMMAVYKPDGSGEMIGFSEKINSEPLQKALEFVFEVHALEIEAGNTVDVDVLRQELVERQNQVAPTLEVAQD